MVRGKYIYMCIHMGFPGGVSGKEPAYEYRRQNIRLDWATKHSTAWESRVQSLGREDPLEQEVATHSSILA